MSIVSPGWKGVKYQRLKLTLTRLHDASCKQHTARGVTTPILYPLIYTTSGQTPRHASMIDDVLHNWRKNLLAPYSCKNCLRLLLWDSCPEKSDRQSFHRLSEHNRINTPYSTLSKSMQRITQFVNRP